MDTHTHTFLILPTLLFLTSSYTNVQFLSLSLTHSSHARTRSSTNLRWQYNLPLLYFNDFRFYLINQERTRKVGTWSNILFLFSSRFFSFSPFSDFFVGLFVSVTPGKFNSGKGTVAARLFCCCVLSLALLGTHCQVDPFRDQIWPQAAQKNFRTKFPTIP